MYIVRTKLDFNGMKTPAWMLLCSLPEQISKSTFVFVSMFTKIWTHDNLWLNHTTSKSKNSISILWIVHQFFKMHTLAVLMGFKSEIQQIYFMNQLISELASFENRWSWFSNCSSFEGLVCRQALGIQDRACSTHTLAVSAHILIIVSQRAASHSHLFATPSFRVSHPVPGFIEQIRHKRWMRIWNYRSQLTQTMAIFWYHVEIWLKFDKGVDFSHVLKS